MRVKFIQSIRLRMALYVLFSIVMAALTDIVVFYFVFKLKANNTSLHYIPPKASYLNNLQNYVPAQNSKLIQFFRVTEYGPLNVLIVFLVTIFFFFIYYVIITRSMVDDIQTLLEGVSNIKAGDFTFDIPVRTQDEIGQLTEAINEMKYSLRELMEQERHTEQTKNELITNVAHDLRTPLTSIRGYVDLLSKEDLSKEKQQKYIQVLSSKTKQLQGLIEALFEYTKFYGGEIQFTIKPLNISCFMEQITDEFYPDFQNAQLQCEVNIEPNLYVKGDGEKLARAFNNILSNAIKYGGDGKLIKIHVYREENEKGDKVVIDTINYGRIIEPKDLARLFEKFYRVEESRSLNTGGAGLGLAITKNIVDKHGGTVSAYSDENGTVIRVSLDLYDAELLHQQSLFDGKENQ